MAKKRLNKYLGALLTGGVFMMIPSCSDYDDHFLPDESKGEETTVTETLWDKIKADEDLSYFAAILEKAKYYKDDTHPVESYTYADVLKSGQVSTVWAPENSSFTESEYREWLEKCETDGYTVQQQLVRNHIALWRHNLSGAGIDTIKMMNAKNMIFDRSEGTFDGIRLIKKNIPAMNGVLHTIGQKTNFEYNFYEFIKYAGETPAFSEFVIKYDTTYFNIGASIEGLPDENGNPTYVDSVYSTFNRLVNRGYWLPTNSEKCMNDVKGFGWGSNLTAEDSMFIMIIPTEKAWLDAYEMLKPYYQYAPSYVDKVKGNIGSAVTLKEYEPDSLQKLNISMDISSPLVFNIHKQPKIGGYESGTPWTLNKFVETKGKEAEYLLNVYGDTIRDVYGKTPLTWAGRPLLLGLTDDKSVAADQQAKINALKEKAAIDQMISPTSLVWDKTSLFNGQLMKMSNGYGYLADAWQFPMEYWKPPVVVEISGGVLYYTASSQYYQGTGRLLPFNNTAYSDITDKYGKVSKNNFYQVEANGTTNPKFEIRLKGNQSDQYMPTSSDVMSGTYDIYLVMVPNWYATISKAGEIDSLMLDTGYVRTLANQSKNKFKVQLRYMRDNGGIIGEGTNTAVTFAYDATKVDTMKVFENFTFPYSYKNLRYCYPTLLVQSAPGSSDLRNGFIRHLNVDQVIMRSKENNMEIVIRN